MILLITCLYVRLDILLTCGKHIDDCIISLRWEVCVDTTSLTHHFLLKCLYQIQIQIFYCQLRRSEEQNNYS